ncbi:PREDICTED: POM121-like protein 2 [Chinchilla lanigera]|uniref:POM121-like protein 2 n=1 Tax=Chinchilla lanigera TaxID=34839 RepID=UPI00069708F2|nr:PREDICTED: POM121-like protein 2 [Chinchilla lanigera]
MGCVLGRPPALPRSPPGHRDLLEGPGARAQPVYRVGRVQQVLRAQHVLRAHAAPLPRRSPCPGAGPGPGPPSPAAAAGWDGFLWRTIWSLRHPGAVRSPVTVQLCPPERRGPASLASAPEIHCAGPSEPELRAPREPVGSDPHGEGVAARPSAFTPLARRGALVAFVPRPGPLPGPLGARSRVPRAPARSAASLGAKRNAICSSYSSTRPGPATSKRGLPRLSPEIPEWPLRKRGKGRPPSVRPPAARRASSRTAGRPGPPREKTPPLPPRPGDLLPETAPAERGSDEDCTLGKKAGQDATEAAADSTPEARPGVRPHACVALPVPGTAAPGADPPLDSREKTSPGPPAPLGYARSEAPPARSPGSVPAAAPRSPGAVTARPAPSFPAAESALPPDPPVTPPAAPSLQSTVFGVRGSPAPHLPAPAPPAATSADSLLKPVLGSLPGSETAVPSDPRIEVAAAPSLGASGCTAPCVLTPPAFQPVFRGALSPAPAEAAFSPGQLPPPPAPVAAQLSRGLVPSTSPAGTCQDPAVQLPHDSSRVVPGFIPLPHAGATGFSPETSQIFPSWQPPSLPAVHQVAVSGQVPGAAQVTAGGSAADCRRAQSPVSASTLVCAPPPALSLSLSSPTPAPPGVMPQPASGAKDGQKEGAPQPVLTPSFSTPLLSGNWAVVPPAPGSTLARPRQSISTQAALGGGVLSAPTSQAPTAQVPAPCPLGFAFGQASPAPGFGAATRSQSGAGSPVFGSMAPRPFAFGGSVTPMECGEPGVTASTHRDSSTSGVLSVGGTVRSGVPRTGTAFEKGPGQNPQRLPSQALLSSLGRAGSSARKPAPGVPSVAPFAQTSRLPGPAKPGSSVGSGVGSPPSQGSVSRNRDPFRSPACLFSIGTNPKSPRSREQRRSQRHHAHRK